MRCEWCKFVFGILAIIISVGYISYQFIDPAPPRTIKIATGKADGAYYKYATIYHNILEKEKFDLQIIPTAGSIEALKMLRNNEVDVAFVQSGTASNSDIKELKSLGSLYFEPLWIFYNRKKPFKYLFDLRGENLYIGENGSGTKALAEAILKENGIDEKNTNFKSKNNPIEELKNGNITAFFSVISASSSKIKNILLNKDIKLFDLKRAKAYAKRFNYLSALELDEGMLDLKNNIPKNKISLIGTTATLVANKHIHPDIVRLLLKTAKKVHSKESIFSKQNQFPTYKFTQIPMDENAKNYLIKGDSFLEKIFPFWIASTIDRLIIMIIPILTLLFPLIKGALPLYRWRIRSKIYKWYKILHELDHRIDAVSKDELKVILKEIEKMQKTIKEDSNIPLSYMGEYYDLRVHLDLIYSRIQERLREPLSD